MRKVRLKYQFGGDSTFEKTEENILKTKSNWEQNNIHHSVQTFYEAVRNEINNTTGKTTQYPNLKKDKIQAMDELRKERILYSPKRTREGPLSSWT